MDGKSPQVFKSRFNDSGLDNLFGGARKTLFLDKHPLNGVTTKNIGIRKGNLFYDLDKQEVDYKDGQWEVKATLKGKQELDLKKKLDDNLDVNFGVSNDNVFVGGKWSFSLFSGSAVTKLKVFPSLNAELSCTADVLALKTSADVALSPAGPDWAMVGASYQLPGIANTHVGGMLTFPDMRSSLGLFTGAVKIPGTQKATLGAEIHSASPNGILLGADLTVDKQLTLTAKTGLSGVAEISATQSLSGMKLRTAIEADLLSGTAGKFGAQVKLDK